MRKFILLLMMLSFNVFAESVDINKASAKEIAAALDGVGEKKAQNIVIYRKKNGYFKSIYELGNVKGIGNKIIEKNKDKLKLKEPKEETKSNKKKTKK